jgi:DNA-nicking Smr family endonuclease
MYKNNGGVAMPVVFDKEGREFIDAFLMPDSQRRQGMISQWVKNTARAIQAAVTEELKTLAGQYETDALSESQWRTLSENLKQKENELHLVMDISFRKISQKDTVKGRLLPPRKQKTQIDLHGKTVAEAIQMVNQFLRDSYYVHERHVYIIHGKGTGTLRTEMHKFLKSHPYVKTFTTADIFHVEDGATEVTMKEAKFG